MCRVPWVMMQDWHDVYFIHRPITMEDLRPFVPPELEIDTFEGMAWISFVYFQTKNMQTRGKVPIPWGRSFLELNTRTYVKYKGNVGVYFFSLDVNKLPMAKISAAGGFLPFRYANITSKMEQQGITIQNRFEQAGLDIEVLRASIEVEADPISRTPFEYWITERHFLWTKVGGMLFRQYNGHSPWILQRAHCTIHENSMVPILNSHSQEIQSIAHYSKFKRAFLYMPVKES